MKKLVENYQNLVERLRKMDKNCKKLIKHWKNVWNLLIIFLNYEKRIVENHWKLVKNAIKTGKNCKNWSKFGENQPTGRKICQK